jgi:hypothetical protein
VAAGPGRPARYEIRVEGALDDHWASWFDGLQVSSQGRETAICGLVPDQSALHGLLVRVRDLGLCLISVRRLGPGGDTDGAWQPDTACTPAPTQTPKS